MITTTYGYKKPEDGDRGVVWFDALEDNIVRVDAHSHDGLDSSPISPLSFDSQLQDILSAAWTVVGGGTYKQTVTMTGGYTFDNITMTFKVNGGTHDECIIYPSIKKITSNTFDIWINDNTIALKVIYR